MLAAGVLYFLTAARDIVVGDSPELIAAAAVLGVPHAPGYPLFAMLDVMRSPPLGMANAPYSWTILIVMTVVGCIGTFVFFARFRHRLAFWV